MEPWEADPAHEADLRLAVELGAMAAEIALPLFHRGVETKHKADGSQVTEADLGVERRLVQVLSERRPTDAILSEEQGATGSSNRRWILDPIDGTAWFTRGLETWGTHVALEQDSQIVLGVITRPLARSCWWAVRGQGAFRGGLGSVDGEQLRVSATADLASSRIAVWDRHETPLKAAVRAQARLIEGPLDGFIELMAGRLEAVFDPHGAPWDLAPGSLIVEEAGGRFSDLEGGRRIDRRGGCYSNGAIAESLAAIISG